MVAGCKAAGYRTIEIMSALFAKGGHQTLSRLRAEHGVEFPVVYDGRPIHQRDTIDQSIAAALDSARLAKQLGAGAINFNPTPKPGGELKTPAELDIEAGAINRLGEALAKDGMRLFLHQHSPEMKENAREWRHWLRNTDPKLASFCLDTDWVLRGGQDVMTILEEAMPRLASMHLRSSKQKVWAETFGDGDIDYRQVAARLKKAGYRGFLFVELAYEKDTAITRPLVENLRIAREYAERVFK
jgi:inosose dehydratase